MPLITGRSCDRRKARQHEMPDPDCFFGMNVDDRD